jgi:hypothetical protein
VRTALDDVFHIKLSEKELLCDKSKRGNVCRLVCCVLLLLFPWKQSAGVVCGTQCVMYLRFGQRCLSSILRLVLVGIL